MIRVRKASWRVLKTLMASHPSETSVRKAEITWHLDVSEKHVDHRCSLEKKIISSFKPANNDS